MNKKTTKLLEKYAGFTSRDIRELKKWWNALSWEEKTLERKNIEKHLGGEEDVKEASEA